MMKRILIAAAALAFIGAAPASAQYYGGGGYGGGGYGGGGGYRGGWDDDDDRRHRRRRDRYEERPRMVMGGICVTSRGNCRTRPAPPNTPCGYDIPGFGHKRGAVVAGGGY
jgi:hypothetical protein